MNQLFNGKHNHFNLLFLSKSLSKKMLPFKKLSIVLLCHLESHNIGMRDVGVIGLSSLPVLQFPPMGQMQVVDV